LTYLDFRNIVDLWDLSGIVWWILGWFFAEIAKFWGWNGFRHQHENECLEPIQPILSCQVSVVWCKIVISTANIGYSPAITERQNRCCKRGEGHSIYWIFLFWFV
jgi:hypothetical protein